MTRRAALSGWGTCRHVGWSISAIRLRPASGVPYYALSDACALVLYAFLWLTWLFMANPIW